MLLAALSVFALPLLPANAGQQEASAAVVVDYEIEAVLFEDPAPTTPFAPPVRNFRSELLLLRKIAADPEVAGVRLRLKGNLDYARTLDLLRELRAIQAAGKKIVCYAEVLSKHDLRLCALADLLVVPPSGLIVLQAPSVEAFYLRDLLSKIDAEMEVLHIGEYKTAFEDMARNSMSDAQREVITCLLEEFYGETRRAIAQGRQMKPEAVDELFAQVIVSPQDALAAGLIDAVSYEDEFDAALEDLFQAPIDPKARYGDDADPDIEAMMSNPFALLANLAQMLDAPAPESPDEPHIAVVYATGPITSGKSKMGFGGTIANMGSDTIVEALEEALEDDNVKAVVLRVNSPGGSATASDMIWRAVERVRTKKPVVASMGSVAGSGGYWISMGCDRIVAQPSTITGSIGVVSALPNVSGTLRKAGVQVEVVAYGPSAEKLAILADGPSDFLKGRITTWMESVYADFIAKASAGRGLDPAALEAVAHGRVWTGRQAIELGLIDALGGYEEALALACELGGGLDPATTPIVEHPRARDLFEMIDEMFQDALHTRSGLDLLLAGTPLPPEVSHALRSILAGEEPFHADRVQAVLPFLLRVH
jgi:protease-4